eukprot:CAMPEP_0169305054 /NCGR_PEP_ID=MMETSP1016-20121227/70206_1 /TAXON_ID=342587 /ORGANISM="Karlodinium micrum, Strain CCMP2283" /LENGTH=116 /DNA_ID=CAMNT_0009397961 /DNA_START=119 /DNA_END=470 /DNA_ORIENTATION=-
MCTNTMLLAVVPDADALRAVWPRCQVHASCRSRICPRMIAILPLKLALAMHSALHPLPTIGTPIAPQEDAFALQSILDKLASVARSAFPSESATAMLLTIDELATVLALIDKAFVA